jgi:N6-adenosine-specific RNA methylase IME4
MIYTDFNDIRSKYQVIYADPPWSYSAWAKHKHVAVANKYQVMSIQELKNLPVAEISEADSILLMWATYPNLPEALDLMKTWGYKYRTVAFTWVKQNIKSDSIFLGLGHYTRGNAEIVLLGKRGKGIPIQDSGVSQIIISRRREHSRKPDEARSKIESLFGEVSRIELFGRVECNGWDVWGNEVDKFEPLLG